MTPTQMTAALEQLVSCESPTSDIVATAACGELFSGMVRSQLDAAPEVIEVDGRRHLRWTWGTPKVLVLGHLDTVWPLGTLARWPFSIDGDVATGPGTFDMKAGVIQALAALSSLSSLDGISMLLTVDEEIGSPTSSALVIDSARGCLATLVCEPSAGGALKIARKGIARYDVEVAGRAAHAGLEPEKGANAGVALAHMVVAAAALGDAALGTTVTPTVMSAGTTTNTVPSQGSLALDVRAAVPDELPRVESALHEASLAVELAVQGTKVVLSGGINRPPLDESSSAELFALSNQLRQRRGLPALRGVAVGGGSDGNFTAGAGVPTLDGLGAVGDGAHAEGEHVLLSEMAPRAQLLADLITELLTR